MSGGGETGSLVMGKRPELYTACLMTSSKWDGDLGVLTASRTPVYLAIGAEDSCYGADSLKIAYADLYKRYEEQGLSEAEIARLLVLDVKPQSYFTGHGFRDQHAGGQAFAHDAEVMGWLFGAHGGRTVPAELEYVPTGYNRPAQHPGTLKKLTYRTWESFSYAEHSRPLTKTAWVYLPYGYTPEQKYDVMYLSHGGWSDETTIMGTPESPHEFKYIMDHAIEDGKIRPLIIVLPTYNNTSGSDSGNYSLSLQLTANFHNVLLGSLIPAVESKYSTYAESTDTKGLAASRDHRGFGGFSMGSMNTWHTFANCLDYFRYFAPASGGPIGDGRYMADLVRHSGRKPEDFFIFAASGTDDFAYAGFKSGIQSMGQQTDVFAFADSEQDGNLAFREREVYTHDGRASNEYAYNALRFFWGAEGS